MIINGYAQMIINILREIMIKTAILPCCCRDYCVTHVTQSQHVRSRQLLETCVSWGYYSRTMIFRCLVNTEKYSFSEDVYQLTSVTHCAYNSKFVLVTIFCSTVNYIIKRIFKYTMNSDIDDVDVMKFSKFVYLINYWCGNL